MVVDFEKATHGQLDQMDRLSGLPDSILHHIISFLGTKESCRTTILSKRWAHIWSTGLVLDFRPKFFVADIMNEVFLDIIVGRKRRYNNEAIIADIERFVNFIETTMRRYSEKNLSVRKFRLESLIFEQYIVGRIDGWLGIALQNQVEELSLSVTCKDSPSYGLPAILFLSKSLRSIKLRGVEMPYSEKLNLFSLQSLDLSLVDVDENMLHDIIKSCPLKILSLDCCFGVRNISIPCCSRLEFLRVSDTVPVDGTILVDTSSIQFCSYLGYHFPIILTPASKKNLRVLSIYRVFIIDECFGKLVSELPSIESMTFTDCTMPKNAKIASQTLRELCICDCYELINLVIEAPNLDTLHYNGNLQLLSVINSHNKYNAYLHLTIFNLDTGALIGIKNLLSKSNFCCKALSITLRGDAPQIEFDKDQLSEIDDGSPNCDVKELELSIGQSSLVLEESSCEALLDGLLWCCRPDILSLSNTLNFHNVIIKTLLEILQKKVKYWKHPLKRMEIDGVNGSSSSQDFDLQLKLYW